MKQRKWLATSAVIALVSACLFVMVAYAQTTVAGYKCKLVYDGPYNSSGPTDQHIKDPSTGNEKYVCEYDTSNCHDCDESSNSDQCTWDRKLSCHVYTWTYVGWFASSQTPSCPKENGDARWISSDGISADGDCKSS
jgi:hypothetical protein